MDDNKPNIILALLIQDKMFGKERIPNFSGILAI